MNRLGLSGLCAIAFVACGHSTPPPAVTPLPADPAAAPEAKAAPTPPPAKPAPEPPKPAPHDTEIAATTTTVKLVAPGKGKRVVAKIAPKEGARTPIELHLDFSPKQDGKSQPTPTLIIHADAEVVTAPKDKDTDTAQFKMLVSSTDTHYAPGAPRVAQLETGLEGIVGMTLTGDVAQNGTTGKLSLHHDAVNELSGQLMELLKVTWMPIWPALPTEAIAPGAKWQTATTFKLAGVLDVTETVDYELVAYKDKTWTIKGTAKLTGPGQAVEGAPVSDIGGTGSVDATLVDGALIPTLRGKLSAAFTVTPPGQAAQKWELELANSIGVDVSPTPSTPAQSSSPK